ncbi:hypothetical protein BH708_05490 [Brachybacterium sp. P6-10-X1]|uniref:hypothetical protein n=1 Tax=Brachybacterium sp. P6-10-X1 TaxID=1903186 RepID=UPI000971866D|nr:hypothetical protein [Brachybacterium sp. P6-10-X1]APX32264.1 hypothetical protein BH708_05490 [Brachybacterium sp. P6-10-X1]
MSTPLSERPRAEDPGSTSSIPPALAQEGTGSPKNFGLNVRRLRRTRIIVFAVLAIPILLLALLAVRFLSMPISQATHLSAYEAEDYPTAIERLAPVQVVNWFEPYLPHLSEGTALLQQGKDAAAEEELRTALDEWNSHSDLNAPLHAQCKIINNLAISIERQADQIEDPQQRADRLYEAEEMLAVCGGGGGGGEGGQGGGSGNEDSGTTEDNGDRVEEKRREADEEAGNDPDERGEQGQNEGDEEGGSPQDPGDPSREDPEGEGDPEEAPTEGDSEQQSKEDELEERNKDAQGGEGEEQNEGSEQDPAKPW